MLQKTKQTISLFILLVVFGSGFAIWGYNRVHGIDLSQPPEIDMTQFQNIDQILGISEAEFQENYGVQETAVLDQSGSEIQNPVLEPGIYFSNFFRKKTATETTEQIKSILTSYSSLVDLPIELIMDKDSVFVAKIVMPEQVDSDELQKLQNEYGDIVRIIK